MTSVSVTQAAALLGTSQPTVSRELKQLEQMLGFTLFERKGRRLQATEQAIALYAEVERSYSGLDQISRSADAIRDFTLSHLRIASLPVFTQTILPPACQRFHQGDPAVRMTIHTFDQPSVLKEIVTQRYDIGLVELGGRNAGLAIEEMVIGDEVCVVPRGHTLADKPILEPADFHGVDFIYFAADDVHRPQIDQAFADAKVSRRLLIEATTAAGVCALVERGVGVSIVNPLSAISCNMEKVTLRPFSVPINYTVGVLLAARRDIQPIVHRLRTALVTEGAIARETVKAHVTRQNSTADNPRRP